jgi:hypothetical protein
MQNIHIGMLTHLRFLIPVPPNATNSFTVHLPVSAL